MRRPTGYARPRPVGLARRSSLQRVVPRVLVVCSANICRSPAMAAILHVAGEQRFDGAFRAASAGMDAVDGQPFCPTCADILRRHHHGPESKALLEVHKSRPLTGVDLDADLILTAERSQRAVLLRDVPALRSRLFTVREAAHLARFVADQGPARPPDRPWLPWLVRQINDARGRAPRSSGRRWDLRHPATMISDDTHPEDIPDAHARGGSHRRTTGLILDSTQRLLASMERTRDGAPSADYSQDEG